MRYVCRMLQGDRILVTGGTGQVGFPVARALARTNEVWVLGRFRNEDDRARIEGIGAKCLAADLLEDSLDSVPEDFTYVLNFAVSKSADASFDRDLAANAEALGRLMYRTRRARAFLHCSTTGVYQPAGHHALVETDPLGDNHRVILPTYSICKIAAEAMARFSARQWAMPTTIARLCVPYGDNGGWPWFHLQMMVAGQPIPVHPEQPNLFNPIHEDDIVAHVPKLLAAARVPATIVNWGGSEAASIEDWCAHMGALTGIEPRFVRTDRTIGSVTIDPTRMHELLGPTRVPWREGIERMIRTRQPELLRSQGDRR
jgi:nucleoside-diphosphate-sugar epimerase